MSNEGKKTLRIGLLMDCLNIPAWVHLMLKRIKHSDYAEIELVVLNKAHNAKKKESQKAEKNLISKILSHWPVLVNILYFKFWEKRFKPTPDALETQNTTNLLADVPKIEVTPIQKKYSQWIKDEDIEKIKNYDIDVFVRLGFGILKGKILKSAKYGIWSYHHGDNEVNRGMPAGFWEVLENIPITGSILQILNEDLDNGQMLYRSYSATDPVSVKMNRNSCFWKSASFVTRKLEELSRVGEENFFRRVNAENKHINFYSNELYRAPRNGRLLKLVFAHLKRDLKRRLHRRCFLDQWFLMFDLRDKMSSSFWRFKKIVPPKDRYWADPFVVYKDSRYYIFIEEFPYNMRKGHISLLVMDEQGKYSEPIKILERSYHLSYPFIFEWEDNYYMIPESGENRTIEVYKCLKFPDKWELHKVLMKNITASDATLFHHEQRWWLFTNVVENEGASYYDELFLFYSDSPLSDNWVPHPMNPIVSDVRRARPAGKFFEHNGSIYRPSQNSTYWYGYGMKINQVVQLSETAYEEKEVSSIEPNWDKKITCVHTLNHENRLTIIDGKLTRPRFL